MALDRNPEDWGQFFHLLAGFHLCSIVYCVVCSRLLSVASQCNLLCILLCSLLLYVENVNIAFAMNAITDYLTEAPRGLDIYC